jgi:glycosyltransferase involved in cell wall biosynthesis
MTHAPGATPTVSVVMPVYNGRRYLTEAVQSILGQTFADFELIVVDDGSTDGSAEMAEAFARRDGRMRTLRADHGGVGRARNLGLAEARGEFIAPMDADDVSLPERLEREVAFLRRRADVVLVGSQVLLIDPDGRPIAPMGGLAADPAEIEALLLEGRCPIGHSSTMMRRAALLKIGGYPENKVCDDAPLFLRLTELGGVVNLPVVLSHYRQHFESVCFRRPEVQAAEIAAYTAEARARRGLPAATAAAASATGPRRRAETRLRWAWSAAKSGNWRTAWVHLAAAPPDLLAGR